MAKDPILDQTVPTRALAEKLSKLLGCSGSHQVSDEAWGPCESQRDLEKLIELGNPAFREWKKNQKLKKAVDEILALKAARLGFSSRTEAEMAAARIGCSGAHQRPDGSWAPCGRPSSDSSALMRRRRARVHRADKPSRRIIIDSGAWENLRERGPIGIGTLPSGGLVSGKALASDSFTPTKGMVTEAERGLEWRKEFGRGGTMVGIARARDIANGKNLPYRTVKRMKAFFDRHQSDAKAEGFRPGESGYPSNGRIAWALWGGDAGYTWAKDVVSRVDGSSKDFATTEEKRFYTTRRRQEYAKRGIALPDGSYPIRDVGDLRNAIQAFGLGKDKPAARRHIMRRARVLGRTDLIPAGWRKRRKSTSPKIG